MMADGNRWQTSKTDPWQGLPLPRTVISRALSGRLPHKFGSGSPMAAIPLAEAANGFRNLADTSETLGNGGRNERQ